jgi:hypothetical protein
MHIFTRMQFANGSLIAEFDLANSQKCRWLAGLCGVRAGENSQALKSI